MDNDTSKTFDIAFDYQGIKYRGSVTPSNQNNENGEPLFYDVVLNGAIFGQLSFNDCRWTISTPRPKKLVEAASKQIEEHYKL